MGRRGAGIGRSGQPGTAGRGFGPATGQVTVLTGATGTTDMTVDVQGYYTNSSTTTTGSTFVALTPTRIYNTATGLGGRSTPIGAAGTAKVPVLGQGGVPSSGVSAVVVNVTASNETANTWLQVWSGSGSAQSNVQVPLGLTVAAMVQTAIGSDGTISVYNAGGTVDINVDVEGYYLDSTQDAATYFVPIDSKRILDTRSGLNTGGKTSQVASHSTLSVPVRGVQVSGSTVIPNSTNVSAVVLAVQAVGSTTGGYLQAFPEGVARPAPTNFLTYPANTLYTVSGTVIAKVGTDGRVSIYASGATHVVVDVEGYSYNTPPPAPPAPGVSSSTFQSNGWAASGASGSVSVSMTSGTTPAVRQYRWALDDPSLANPGVVNVAADNATGSFSLSPVDGWHTMYVQAVNTAGNTSPVTSYTFGAGIAVTSPTNNSRTTRYVRLDARASSSYTGFNWRYRRAASDPWVPVDTSQVTLAGAAVSSWQSVPVTVSGSSAVAPEAVWDLSAAFGGVDGSVMVEACFTTTSGSTCTNDAAEATITLDKLDAGNTDASTSVGVGDVDLLTGNLALSGTDAQIAAPGSDLTVARTFNTLDPSRTTDAATGKTSVFGPGWTTGLPVDSAGSSWTGLADRGSTVSVTDMDGVTTTFAKTSGGTFLAAGDDADSGLTLAAGTAGTYGPATWTISDLDGNATRFAPTATLTHTASTGSPNPYQVDQVTQPGSAQTTSYSYDSAGHPTEILAPIPAGATCTGTTTSTWTGGCRALLLTYGTTGSETGRLTAVTYRTTDASGVLLDVDLACYAYDTNARLAAVWDPRDGSVGTGSHPVACSGTQYRPTTYTYDSNGRVASITPPGLAASTLGYDGSGRLTSVTRTHNAANGGASETTSITYAVATTADSSNPAYRPDLSRAAVTAWGQTEAPITATAIFGPGHVASGTDLRGAAVSYLNPEGRIVNTAQYSGTGAAGWHIDTTDYDSHGKAVRTLAAANREEALNPDTADPALKLPNDGDPATTGDSAAAAGALSTVNVYSYDAAGVGDLVDTFGPWHLTRLPNGAVTGARQHTHNSYDTGTETGHPAGGVLHLITKTTIAASLSQQAVATSETDTRTTLNDYALSASDATGWTFRQPMRVTADPNGLAITKGDTL
jgi:YD repeat-containing protein